MFDTFPWQRFQKPVNLHQSIAQRGASSDGVVVDAPALSHTPSLSYLLVHFKPDIPTWRSASPSLAVSDAHIRRPLKVEDRRHSSSTGDNWGCSLRRAGSPASGSLSYPAGHRRTDSEFSARNAAGRPGPRRCFSRISSASAVRSVVGPFVAGVSAEFFQHRHACRRPGTVHHCRFGDGRWKVAPRI